MICVTDHTIVPLIELQHRLRRIQEGVEVKTFKHTPLMNAALADVLEVFP